MPRPATTPQAKQFNILIGGRVAGRRRELGLSVRALERELLLAPGAMGRIERGEKSLDAGTLIALAGALAVPIGFFFDGMPRLPAAGAVVLPPGELTEELGDFLASFHRIDDEEERRQIASLIRAVADPAAP